MNKNPDLEKMKDFIFEFGKKNEEYKPTSIILN
jgi:hypothetical protein